MEDNLQTLENKKKTIPYIQEEYDVVVVGAGHAGCEAALACARLGLETIMFTVSVDSIAMMPCNPNIGGSSKGHLVREVDALGGEMGKNIDKTFIQSKMLNKSKGPAVHSLRAQADKAEYTKEMRKTLQNTDHLTIRQAEVAEILTDMDHFFDEDTIVNKSTMKKWITLLILKKRCKRLPESVRYPEEPIVVKQWFFAQELIFALVALPER